MIKHFFTVAYRNLLRNKIFSVINVVGLAIGMACCLLIVYYVQHELSYDRYHTKGDRIYRLTQSFQNSQAGEKLPPPTPEEFQVWGNAPVGAALANDFPTVEKVVQFTSPNTFLLQHGETRIQQDNLLFMDSTAFEVFSWKMLAGNPLTALKAPNSIVLTKSVARKFFGNTNPVGQSLKGDNAINFLVTGVMEDVPSNSHFNFTGLISMSTFRIWRPEIFDAWGYVDFYTYFLLKESTFLTATSRARSIERAVDRFMKLMHAITRMKIAIMLNT